MAEGVPTNNQRGRRSGSCRLWGGLDKARHIVPTALLVRVQYDFNFHITNFPFLSSNIPSSPAYGVFISQLIRYARACSSYECFILRAARLLSKLLGQGYVMERLKSSIRKFYGRYGELIKHYEVSLSQMLHDILGHDHIQWHPQLIRHYTNLRTYYRTGLYYRFWLYYQILEVSIEHCNGCG